MGKGRTFEAVMGIFVLVIAGLFFNYVYHKSSWKNIDGYELIARFDHADGMAEGVDVKISGLRVGKVLSTEVDTKNFLAIVRFYVSKDIKLPKDTTAKISNEGLLGEKYLEISPGEEDEILQPGDEIVDTAGPVNLESLIGNFLFSKNEKDSKNEQD